MDFEPKSTDFDGLDGLVKRLGLAWLGLPFSRWKQAESSRDPNLKPSRPKPTSAWLGLACLFRSANKPSKPTGLGRPQAVQAVQAHPSDHR